MLQSRPNGATEWYCPQRDLAHIFDGAVLEVAKRLEAKRWPFHSRYLKETSGPDINRALAALCGFVLRSRAAQSPDLWGDLEASGWSKIPEPARLAVVAQLGVVVMGYFWLGVHDGVGPSRIMRPEELREAAGGLIEALYGRHPSRWRSWFAKLLFWRRTPPMSELDKLLAAADVSPPKENTEETHEEESSEGRIEERSAPAA